MSEGVHSEDIRRKPGRPKKSAAEVSVAASQVSAAENTFWESIRDSKDQADFHDYIEQWPEGFFAGLAQRRLDRLADDIRNAGASDEGEEYYADSRIKKQVIVPTAPIPVIDYSKPLPKYRLLAKFFAENDTLYDEDQDIDYLGPPNEHMLPLNEQAIQFKREQEEYLDACWAVKCRAEGKPAIPRPRELADQIEAERNMLRRDHNGVVNAVELPPTRPDLAKQQRLNPNASRVGAVTPGGRYADRGMNAKAPVLGRDGARYEQAVTTPGIGTNPALPGGFGNTGNGA